MVTGVAMSKVKARPTFGSAVARAGITRLQLATAAEVSVRTVDSLANPTAAGRSGQAREITAWRIARGFARLTSQTDDAAFDMLFIAPDLVI